MAKPTLYHWLCLLGAIAAEVGGTTLMKLSQAWTWPLAAQAGLAGMLILIGFSYYLLSLAATGLPVGVAFACWEGLGLALITLSSVCILGEHLTLTRLAALCCVLAGAMLIHKGTTQGTAQGAPTARRA